MKNTKLIQVLKTFSRKELSEFKLFYRSPYFNKNDRLTRFIDQVMLASPGFSDKKVAKKRIYQSAFPGEKFEDLRMRHMVSDGLKLVERFLVHNRLEENEDEHWLTLVEAYQERNLEKHFQGVYKKIENILDKRDLRNLDYYFNRYRVEAEMYKLMNESGTRASDVKLQQAADNLDVFYLINKLKFCCVILAFQGLVPIQHKLLLMEEILEHLKKNNYDHIPAIAIYYQILMTMLKSEEESHFYKLKKLLKAHSGMFSLNEARDFYHFALNYCIKKLNQGNDKYLKECFELYKETLDKKIIFEQGLLSPWNYKNIIAIGLKLGEFDWVEKFIYGYKERIKAEYRKNAYTYNLAKLFFYRGDYQNVIKLLQQVDYEDIFYALDSKATLIKTYYEVDEVDSLFSLLESFKVYLNRNKMITDLYKTNYLKFIKYVRKLVHVNPVDKEEVEKLKQEVEANKDFADASWLEEKVNEMRK